MMIADFLIQFHFPYNRRELLHQPHQHGFLRLTARADRLRTQVGKTLDQIGMSHGLCGFALRAVEHGFGRFAGANRPLKPSNSSAGKPCSRTVGTSGRMAMRFAPVVASAFNWPPRISCNDVES